MKNTCLLFISICTLFFWSCKKDEVDLNPAKRLKTVESDGSVTTYFYDNERRLSKTIVKSGVNTTISTYDYSMANQITQIDELDNNAGTKVQTIHLMTMNKEGLVTLDEVTQTTTSAGQNPRPTDRRSIEYTYNADKNLIATINTVRNITTGALGAVTMVDNNYFKKNLTSQTVRNKPNGVNDVSTTTSNNEFKSDKNTLGLSYRGQNYFGVSSLNLAVSVSQLTRNVDQTNSFLTASTTEATTTYVNSLDGDGYLIKREATVKSSFTNQTGNKTTNPDRTTTTIYTYE
jgi:hypothetical protein